MTTLCPNCSRPARKGATYCGYCGSNLKGPVLMEQALPALSNTKNKKMKKQGQRKDPARTLAIIAIILLILIIGGALIAQNWVEVLTFIFTSAYNLFAG